MKQILIGILFAGIILLNFGCPKPCIEANYSFAVTASFKPDMDSIKIGDTIYLTSSFNSQLEDLKTSATVDYSASSGIGNTLSIIQFSKSDTLGTDAVFNFNYLSIDGKIYNDRNIARPDGVQQLFYKEDNGLYKLKIGIIPKVSGLYVLGLGIGLSNGRSRSHSCEKASFNTSVTNTNQHFYLLYNVKPDAHFYGNDSTRGYYFKVN